MMGYSGYSPDVELSVLRAFMGREPDAIVLTGVEHNMALRRLLRTRKLPTVEMWDLVDDPIDIAVGFDNVAAGAAVAEYLAKAGVKRPAIMGSDPTLEARAAKRTAGFEAGCQSLGLCPPIMEPLRDGMSAEEAEAGFRRLISRAPDMDGLFCLNDALAIAALMEARRLSINVPGRMRIAGFGDFDLAAHVAPRLTTVRVPGYEIGRRAARRLLERIEGQQQIARVESLPFELVPRESA
jgi:LacI family gluconate utilization system Gnt-I transcriptional repressor